MRRYFRYSKFALLLSVSMAPVALAQQAPTGPSFYSLPPTAPTVAAPVATMSPPMGEPIPTPFVTSAQGGYTAPANTPTLAPAPAVGGASLGAPSFGGSPGAAPLMMPATSAPSPYSMPAAPSTPYGTPAGTNPYVSTNSPYAAAPQGASPYAASPYAASPYAAAPYSPAPGTGSLRGPTAFPGSPAPSTYGTASVRQFNNAPLLAQGGPGAMSPTPAPYAAPGGYGPAGGYGSPAYGAPGYGGGSALPAPSGGFGSMAGYGGGPAYGAPQGPASGYGVPYAGPGGYHTGGQGGACGCEPSGSFGGECCPPCGRPSSFTDHLTIIKAVEAFKSPVDLDGLNANFGGKIGLNLAMPVYAPWGLGVQAGSTVGWYNPKGTLFTGDDDRFQNFYTAGLYQRSPFGLNWSCVYDWLLDDYYSDFRFEQLRAAVSYSFNPYNELGVWSTVPMRKDSATVGAPPVNNTFEPLMQGAVYYQRAWNDGAYTRIWGGLAEQPGDAVWGVSSQAALTSFAALNGQFHYVLPSAGGNQGRQEELWFVSFGITLYPGSALRAATSPTAPVLPIADNGNFGVIRR